jgi:hypothetical protein
MAKQSRATFQKREKERARQQKQHDKAQRRLVAKERRSTGALHIEDDDPASTSILPGQHAVPTPWDNATPTD